MPLQYEFGAFHLDPAGRSLMRNGNTLTLTPKAFDVLVFLIHHRHEVVSREELFRNVWPDCAVEDATLTQHIYLIRRALRSAGDEKMVATIPRRGYRFMPTVRESLLGNGLAADPSPQSVSDRRRPQGEIVGRVRELQELHQALARVTNDGLQIVCISGEAGIGKTALVDTFIQDLSAAPDVRVARSRCSERFGESDTYLPTVDLLDDCTRRYGPPAAALLRTLAPHWQSQIDSARPEYRAPTPAGSPDQLKREFRACLEGLSREAAFVAFIDDWHWAGHSTVELLAYVAAQCDRMRVLFVLAYRPAELAARNALFVPVQWDLQARMQCHALTLGPLTPADVERYVTDELRPHPVPAGLVAFMYSLTEGNPLFLVDLLKHLRSQHLLVESDGRWAMSHRIADLRRELPESTRGMIRRMLGLLTEVDRKLLIEASVQGYEFDTAILAEVVRCDVADVERQLEALDGRGAVTLIAQRDLPDGTRSTSYVFRHVLYQNSLYDSLGGRDRATSSRRVADVILAHSPDVGRVAARVAVLLEAGGDAPRAVTFFAHAAQEAFALSAFPDAINLARRGLTLRRSIQPASSSRRDELSLLLTLGAALGARDGNGGIEVRRTYGRAYRLCGSCDNAIERLPALIGLWSFYGLRGEFKRASRLSKDLLQVATNGGDDILLARACATHGSISVHLGDLEGGRTLLERGLAINCLDAGGGAFILDVRVHLLSHLAEALSLLGFLDQATERGREATDRARQTRSPYSLVFALNFLALVHRNRCDATRALECADEAVAIAAAHDMSDGLAWGSSLQAWALSNVGHAAVSVTRMRALMDGQRKTARNPQYFAGTFAEILAAAGLVDEAAEQLSIAIAAAERTGDVLCVPWLLRLQSEILVEAGDREQAMTCAARSIQMARRQHTKTIELQATASLARMRSGRGECKSATQKLFGVYRWFTEGHDTELLKGVAATLRAFEARSAGS